MPDITMCQNKRCKKRCKCYRYLAKAGIYQSYFLKTDENNCEHFINVKHYKDRIEKCDDVDKLIEKLSGN